jgi:replicative DNA helicase
MDNFAAMFSLEAEQSLIGALMLSESAWDDAGELVGPADFVRQEHRVLFSAIARLAEQSKQRDGLTVAEKLLEFNELDEAGGKAYIGELIKNTPSSANAKAYAEIVRDRAQLRRLMTAFKQGEADIENPDLALSEKVSSVTERLESALCSLSSHDEAKSAKDAGRSWLEVLNQRFNAGSSITGIPTGFPQLDKAIRGLNKKHLLVLAARPSVGKSTLAANIVRNVLHANGSVFLATMEMSTDDVMTQLCAAHTGCPYEKIQDAHLGDEEVQAATGIFSQALINWRLSIDDRGTQTVASIRRGVKRHIRLHGHSLLVVDYAQLVSHKAESETVRIGEISRGFKELAQDLDIPVILISQLNRESDKRGGDGRPRLVDLRGSGSLEQDASEVVFLHDEGANDPAKATPFTELIIAKNRHGKRNLVLPLLKQLDRARFVTPDFRELPDDWRGQQSMKSARRAEPV